MGCTKSKLPETLEGNEAKTAETVITGNGNGKGVYDATTVKRKIL